LTEATDSRKRRRPLRERLLPEFAFLLALLLHAVLFFGFKARPPESGPVEVQHDPPCILVSRLQQPELSDWERSLHEWSVIGSPALLTLPNRVLGFSVVRPEERPRPVTDVPTYSYRLSFAAEESFPPFFLSSPTPPRGWCSRRRRS